MAKATAGLAAAILMLATAACERKVEVSAPATASALTEADTKPIVDKTEAAWVSMDAARIKALYAPGIVGFDAGVLPLSTDRATWDKLQDGYVTYQLDKASEKARKIQILGPDAFVLSGYADLTSTAKPKNTITLRYTDVFQKQADGSWLIVNEHTSTVPKA